MVLLWFVLLFKTNYKYLNFSIVLVTTTIFLLSVIIFIYNDYFFIKVALVERNIMPQGTSLVDPATVAKSSKQDLMALVTEIEKVYDICVIFINKLNYL